MGAIKIMNGKVYEDNEAKQNVIRGMVKSKGLLFEGELGRDGLYNRTKCHQLSVPSVAHFLRTTYYIYVIHTSAIYTF